MPVSLEDLDPQDRGALNLGRLVAQMLTDPQLGPQTKRLLKTKQPTLSFPELENEDQLKKVREDSEARVKKLEDEILKNRAIAALQAEDKKIEEAGLEPKAIRKFMDEQGITNVDVVIELFQSRQQLAEPSTPQFQPLEVPNIKEMWENPVQWREREAHKVLSEIRGTRPSIRQVG